MSDTKISEAAVEAALNASAGSWQVRDMLGCDESEHAEVMGFALSAALPHLHPQPTELAEQQGDARAQFEAWHCEKFKTCGQTGAPTRDMHNGVYADNYGPAEQQERWELWQAAWQAVLAATGKQQVGEVQALRARVAHLERTEAALRSDMGDVLRDRLESQERDQDSYQCGEL